VLPGAVVVAGVTLAGFAWLQVRPLPWTVLTAAVVTVRMLWALVAAIPVACARHWRASMGAAPVPALVALAAAPGWPRVAGLLSLATLLAASLVLPAPVHRALQRKLR
jgi:hypothetical protein